MDAVWIEPGVARLATTDGGRAALEVRLGGVPRGAVIVVSPAPAFDGDVPVVLNRLAEHGYESVGIAVAAAGATDEGLLGALVAALDRLVLRGWSAEQVGVVGYGAGGRAAVVAACRLGLGAAVSVAPTWAGDPAAALDALARRVETLRVPWLALLGARDPDAPAGAVDRLRHALDLRSPVFARLVVYPGVGGGFHLDAAAAEVHAAAFDAWQRTVEWFDQRVVPRPTPLAEAWRDRAVPAVPTAGTGACPIRP